MSALSIPSLVWMCKTTMPTICFAIFAEIASITGPSVDTPSSAGVVCAGAGAGDAGAPGASGGAPAGLVSAVPP